MRLLGGGGALVLSYSLPRVPQKVVLLTNPRARWHADTEQKERPHHKLQEKNNNIRQA